MTSTIDSAAIDLMLVDDDPDIRTAGRMLLRRQWPSIDTVDHPKRLPIATERPRVVLLDMNFSPGDSSGQEGLHWLERIVAREPDTVVIMVTAHGDMKIAVEAMKRGATDFVSKPWQNEKLLATVSAAARLAATQFEARALRERNMGLSEASAADMQPIIGQSKPMREVLSLVERSAPSDANVLILGENGTGKDLVARAIHRASNRADQALVAIDLGAVPDSLFESELFGHRKGAFTDARGDRVGRFLAANQGTLFLDEIGNVPLPLQAKLLGALETRTVTPIGASTAQPFDVRLISATNLQPEQLMDPNRFRTDLLYRLNTIVIQLPPLRARREDIPELVRHFATLYERRYGKPHRELPESVLMALSRHDWPGNVRALRHAIERAVILANGQRDRYETQDFLMPDNAPAVHTDPDEPPTSTLNLEQLERSAVQQALSQHGFNISRAAKELGLTRAALYRRMEKYDI
ncbi:MAG: sigma-54 dependent transcriptional regulator [Pseudomonadota bacterium]